jgi:hypothetical protein
MSDDLAQILPNQVIKLLGWAKAGSAFFFLAAVNRISFGCTNIITGLAFEMPARTRGQTATTTDQSPQEIVVRFVVSFGKILILR